MREKMNSLHVELIRKNSLDNIKASKNRRDSVAQRVIKNEAITHYATHVAQKEARRASFATKKTMIQSMHMQKNYMNKVKDMDTIFEAKLMKINMGEKIGEILEKAKTKRIEQREERLKEISAR